MSRGMSTACSTAYCGCIKRVRVAVVLSSLRHTTICADVHRRAAMPASQMFQFRCKYCGTSFSASLREIIQRFEPIYHDNPAEKFFMAPLFSSVKYLAGKKMNTLPGNLMVIWGMTLILYLTLQMDLFRKIINLKRK